MSQLNCILLIDDDEITNFINVNLLQDLQIARQVEVATNGKEAISILEERCQNAQCPELILLDINMPVLDGFEFLEQLDHMGIKKNNAIKIVALTTSNNPKDLKKLQELGVETLVNKPLTKEKVEQLIA